MFLYRTKPLSRTYLYDFVCDVTRFTHLVTSQRGAAWERFSTSAFSFPYQVECPEEFVAVSVFSTSVRVFITSKLFAWGEGDFRKGLSRRSEG
jgi:hypothetical protein